MTKYGKKIIAQYAKHIDGENFEVVILDDGDYDNVHIISEKYKNDEMNTLFLQEPKEAKVFFDRDYMIARLMEHFIWDRFYNEFEEPPSVSVTFYKG